MAMSLLKRLAAAAPVPVFAAIGIDGLRAVERLSPDPHVALVASPRHAGVLLVVGDVPRDDLTALSRVHDQMPDPRATVWWGTKPLFGHETAVQVDGAEDPAPALAALYRDLMSGARASDPDLLPNEPPTPWRGKGDFGQGGEGMMGGTPYGRPMPMTDDDIRDGLALDPYSAPFGPFLPVFPPGLILDLTLQGDVIQQATVSRPPYPQHETGGAAEALRRVARMVRLLGLPARAEGLLRRRKARGLETRLRRWGVFAAIPPGLGVVDGADVRDRLRDACAVADGRAASAAAPPASLPDLLPGLEWHEAVLVLNSLPEAALGREPA